MPYVERDASGRIIAIHPAATAAAGEQIAPDSAELLNFLRGAESATVSFAALDKLAESDQALVRVLEDLVETLIRKDLIHFTDLPDAAQNKLLQRRSLRQSVNALTLFRGDDQKLF